MMYIKNRQLLLVVSIFLLYVNSTIAQNNSHDNKLPWVLNELPTAPIGCKYKVIQRDAVTLKEAQQNSIAALILELATEKGVKISNQAVNEISSKSINRNHSTYYDEKETYKQVTNIKQDDFAASFTTNDEYYEYRNGRYHLWTLYLVANEGKTIPSVIELSYKLDNGAWRSLIVPGWAQLYTRQHTKGIVILVGEVGLLATAFYMNDRAIYSTNRLLEANSVKIKEFYKKQSDNYTLYRNVSFGAAVAWYIYNVVDAFTSQKGRLTYKTKGSEISFSPILYGNPLDNSLACGISISF